MTDADTLTREETLTGVQARLEEVQGRIAGAAKRAGRDASEVTLVAVTKTVATDRIAAAHGLGLRDFGENRVQEAQAKVPAVNERLSLLRLPRRGERIRWHMIGHLQRNKVRQAVRLFDLIHSVDSVRLAEEISRRCQALGRTMPILLEVNVSGETSKFGFAPDGLESAVEDILSLPSLDLRGLMTMAPVVAVPEDARPYFTRLRDLRNRLRDRFPEGKWAHLSMGMTDDFEIAIEEGATLVRIGRAIFGERRA